MKILHCTNGEEGWNMLEPITSCLKRRPFVVRMLCTQENAPRLCGTAVLHCPRWDCDASSSSPRTGGPNLLPVTDKWQIRWFSISLFNNCAGTLTAWPRVQDNLTHCYLFLSLVPPSTGWSVWQRTQKQRWVENVTSSHGHTTVFGRSRFLRDFTEGRRSWLLHQMGMRRNGVDAGRAWAGMGEASRALESSDRPARRWDAAGRRPQNKRSLQRIQHCTHKRHLMAADDGWTCEAWRAWFHSSTVKWKTKPHGCGLLKWHLPVIKPFTAAHYCRGIYCTWKVIPVIKSLSTF